MAVILNQQWLGDSPAVVRLKRQIDKFAGVDFPLIIIGETGAGKALAARAIHGLSTRVDKPWVSADCCSWPSKSELVIFENHFQQAQGGSLLLKNLNALPREVLNHIQHVWKREYATKDTPVRVMCTFSKMHPNAEVIEAGAPWLSLNLPTLEERREDIPQLLSMLGEKYKNINELVFTDECWPVLLSHKWPDNVKGLERFYAKLAVLSDSAKIVKKTLFEHFPEMRFVTVEHRYKATHSARCDSPKLGSDRAAMATTHGLAQQLLANEIPESAQQHIAVTRSLEYLIQEFNEKITIEQVAKTACVSSPHLSFLFRKHLGVSFKKLLLELRIEYSKTLLRSQPAMQITQISQETGFHDLSHFEKTFRRLVGVKPSHYRRGIC